MVSSSVKTACERDELPYEVTDCKIGYQMPNIRFVHVRSGHGPGFVAFVHESHHFVITVNDQFREVFYVWTKARMLSHSQVARVLWIE